MKEISITKLEANQRVDKFVRKYLNDAPLSFIYKLFRKKDVKANGHWVDIKYIIKENDVIRIYVSDSQLEEFNKPKEVVAVPLTCEIIFEDNNILIINKPKGILVHGDENEKRNTLSNQVLNYLYFKKEYDPKENIGFVPAPAHRIDRNTSGIVCFAKNLESLQALEQLFKDKTELEKYYLVLVEGRISEPGEIKLALKKDEENGVVTVSSIENGGKTAYTKFVPIKVFDEVSLVEAQIITGRTHQIRVHFQAIGHPVVGDGKYGHYEINRRFKVDYKLDSQFLHSYKMKFGSIKGILSYLSNKTFVSPLPKLEQQIIDNLI